MCFGFQIWENISSVFRAKNVKNISGNELGLALTEKIIRIHQGTIFIESQLQKGKK